MLQNFPLPLISVTQMQMNLAECRTTCNFVCFEATYALQWTDDFQGKTLVFYVQTGMSKV
jgi:hypothetical protein